MTWKESSNKVIDSFGWCTMHPKTSFKTKLQMSEFHFVALGWDPLYFSYVVLCTLKVRSTKYKKYKLHPDNMHPKAFILDIIGFRDKKVRFWRGRIRYMNFWNWTENCVFGRAISWKIAFVIGVRRKAHPNRKTKLRRKTAVQFCFTWIMLYPILQCDRNKLLCSGGSGLLTCGRVFT